MGWSDSLPIIRQANEAQNEAGFGAPGGPEDARRHAIWAAKLSKDYGRPVSLVATTLAEVPAIIGALRLPKEDRQRVWDETLMDLKNNIYGSQNPAATVEQLRSAPLEALPPYWGKKQGQ